jgi:hypothetical protein
MNEDKILSLAEKAGFDIFLDSIYVKNEEGIHRATNEVHRFAELIVAECVEQVLTGVRTNPPQPQPPELVQILVRRIRQHFGVEP